MCASMAYISSPDIQCSREVQVAVCQVESKFDVNLVLGGEALRVACVSYYGGMRIRLSCQELGTRNGQLVGRRA